MIIENVELFQYSLPLAKPLYVRGNEVHEREGFIIKVTANGISGYGDVAPLKGLSEETTEVALAQLKRLQLGLIDQPIPDGLEKLDDGFKNWIGVHNLCSSAQFGIELAILNLLANTHNTTLAHLISDEPYLEITINGFLNGTKEEVKTQARQLIAQGFHSLKLKVNDDVDAAIETVLAINPIIEGKAVLHIDANQAWSIADAVKFGHEVGLATVDYIEEPFKNLNDIGDFFMKTTIPAALDETLRTQKIKDFKMIDGLEVLILKPTVLGGLETCRQLIHQARGAGMSTVISSCFESSIGILGLANLAGVSSRHQGAGLDTLKFFKEDVLNQPIASEHGKLNIENQRIDENNLNFNVLQEILL